MAGETNQQPQRTFVLVAKTLTKSDTQGRVILPRVAVEANLAFIVGYRWAATLQDPVVLRHVLCWYLSSASKSHGVPGAFHVLSLLRADTSMSCPCHAYLVLC